MQALTLPHGATSAHRALDVLSRVLLGNSLPPSLPPLAACRPSSGFACPPSRAVSATNEDTERDYVRNRCIRAAVLLLIL